MDLLNDMQFEIAEKIQQYYKCHIIHNDSAPYILFKLVDIGSILNMKNINVLKFSEDESQIIKVKTITGNHPAKFITIFGLYKLVSRSRKQEVIDFCNTIGIDQHLNFYCKIETETLYNIRKCFRDEEMISQYKVNKYFIDLYFPEYKLAIECDETQHNVITNKLKDIEREIIIKNNLDCTFIRYKPFDKDFNVFDVINQIYKHIILCKSRIT